MTNNENSKLQFDLLLRSLHRPHDSPMKKCGLNYVILGIRKDISVC